MYANFPLKYIPANPAELEYDITKEINAEPVNVEETKNVPVNSIVQESLNAEIQELDEEESLLPNSSVETVNEELKDLVVIDEDELELEQ